MLYEYKYNTLDIDHGSTIQSKYYAADFSYD